MTLYFIRHADKAQDEFINPDLPHFDQPISEIGKKQSRKLCKHFIKNNIEEFYISQYFRTFQTIELLAKKLKI